MRHLSPSLNNGRSGFLAKVETWEDEASETKQKKIAALRTNVASLKAKLERLNNASADGGLDLQEFKEMKNPLVPQKVEVEQQIIALERSTANRLEPLKNWIIEANQAETWASENGGLI